jgi:hypothetical protein
MDDTQLKTKRFGANFWIIITAVLGIGLGSIGTWTFINHYVKVPTPVELAFPKKKAPVAAATTTVDPNAGYVVISEFGVRFKTNDQFTGLTHLYKNNAGTPTVYFSTVGLTNSDALCGADKTTTGALTQYKAGQMYFDKPIEQSPLAYKVGSYYYQFTGAQSFCSSTDNDAVNKQQTAVMDALKAATASIEAAK